MSSVDIQKHTMGKASNGCIQHNFRLNEHYSNEDIELEQSDKNIILGCDNAREAREKLHNRIEEVDSIQPPLRVKKDRVVGIGFEIPAPREGMREEEVVEFLKRAYEGLQELFGAENIIYGAIHIDEQHQYKGVDGMEHESRIHLHVEGVPYTEEKGINGKAFLQKSTYHIVNQKMDEICMEMFGYTYQDGTKQQSKGTVEQLKQGEKQYNALMTEYNALKSDLEVIQGQIEAQNIQVLDTEQINDIVSHSKTTLGGDVKIDRKTWESIVATASQVDKYKSEYPTINGLKFQLNEMMDKLQDIDNKIASMKTEISYLNISQNKKDEMFKELDNTLKEYRKVIDDYDFEK